ncbi:MAG TPA: putative aminohydrolase SsnA [Bacteroidota bacterium]|nr:putative aminohydrolase SsnA [Bacteroidota bacterium]
MSFLLKNITGVTVFTPFVESVDLRIDDGKIIERGKLLNPKSGDEVIDLNGKLVMPGLVNAHTHLYSSLSRGMPAPSVPPKNFVEILKKIWWRLDESLDDEAVYYSALVGAMESAKLGTTMLIDHHASPNFIHGSLDLIKEAMSVVGMRGVLCYETTNRGGAKRCMMGLEENERFLTENVNHPHFKGLIGAHASFTLEDETLVQLGDLVTTYSSGIHIHVAEGIEDVQDANKNRTIDIVRRLAHYQLLTKKSILAHGVHLSKHQIQQIQKHHSWIVHNPESNMNNGVGYAPVHLFGTRTALGTDGFPSDMFEQAKIGYFRNAESDAKATLSTIPQFLQSGNAIASELFAQKFGSLEKGSAADLIVLDYLPPTPLVANNILGHFLFGMRSSHVESVMVDGRWIVWNRQLPGVDEEAVMFRARNVAQKLWKKMAKK